MWLLNTRSFRLKSFTSPKNAPAYAILSHCWEEDEVTLADMQDLYRPRTEQTRSSSAELSEAINSMYAWYRESGTCLAYPSDVPDGSDTETEGSPFRRSRWFKRGWTLQELIAPWSLTFLSQGWLEMGSRISLAIVVEKITKIDYRVLRRDHQQTDFARISVARRMTWAVGRETTRAEDKAYSLMGLFDVNMPTLYGEGGKKAFLRLQVELIRQYHDYSIFAWGRRVPLLSREPLPFTPIPRTLRPTEGGCSVFFATLFASSPDDFKAAVSSSR